MRKRYSISGVDASLQDEVTGSNEEPVCIRKLLLCELYTISDTQKVPLLVRKAITIAYPFD